MDVLLLILPHASVAPRLYITVSSRVSYRALCFLFFFVLQHGGWLPLAAMEKVAKIVGQHEMKVYEVATFYTMFNREKRGKHFIQLCGTTPCMVCGSEDIKKTIMDELGIKNGGEKRERRSGAMQQFIPVDTTCMRSRFFCLFPLALLVASMNGNVESPPLPRLVEDFDFFGVKVGRTMHSSRVLSFGLACGYLVKACYQTTATSFS